MFDKRLDVVSQLLLSGTQNHSLEWLQEAPSNWCVGIKERFFFWHSNSEIFMVTFYPSEQNHSFVGDKAMPATRRSQPEPVVYNQCPQLTVSKHSWTRVSKGETHTRSRISPEAHSVQPQFTSIQARQGGTHYKIHDDPTRFMPGTKANCLPTCVALCSAHVVWTRLSAGHDVCAL